jgi:hypothetical protein
MISKLDDQSLRTFYSMVIRVRGSPSIVDCGVRASEEEDKSVDLQERHEKSSKSSATCEEGMFFFPWLSYH